MCVCVDRLKRRKTCIILQGAGGDGGGLRPTKTPPPRVNVPAGTALGAGVRSWGFRSFCFLCFCVFLVLKK